MEVNMFKGVFIGKNATKQTKRILILGESHYEENGKIEDTKSVIKYICLDGNLKDGRFFENVLRTFGYETTPKQRTEFWNKVYFGNYVEELCGKGINNTAEDKIKRNREKYNNSLFDFINKNQIDIVFCFSRLVSNNLPDINKNEKESYPITGKFYLSKREYLPQCSHKHTECKLLKSLTVYGLKHASAYYNYSNYRNYFLSIRDDLPFI